MIDLVYLARNRREFTEESFSMLLENTDWSLVQDFHVYDDGSVDGTVEYLEGALHEARDLLPDYSLKRTEFGSPISILNDFVENTQSLLIAKIDNDTVVPPRWLNSCVEVMSDSQELQCLGIEAFYEVDCDPFAARGFEHCAFTGGIGVFRRAPFKNSMPQARGIYFGLGIWQQAEGLLCGWIRPSLPVFLLDRLPFDYYRALSERYIEQGWQRPWTPYNSLISQDLWAWCHPTLIRGEQDARADGNDGQD